MSLSLDLTPMSKPENLTAAEDRSPLPPSDPDVVTTAASGDSMQEFYQLQRTLFRVTLVAAGVIFVAVWITYSLSTAASYLLGASVGMFYLSRLAKDVAGAGTGGFQFGGGRIAIFIGLVVIATQLQSLQLLPVILGFLTYKVAILIYTVQTAVLPE